MSLEIWDLRYPNAAAQGLWFGRSRLDPADVVLAHSAPESLRVEVRENDGRLRAFGDQLRRTGGSSPMTRLRRREVRIEREDGWPDGGDLGRPVLFAGR